MFLIGNNWFNIYFFSLLIIILFFLHSFWFCYITHRYISLGQSCHCVCFWIVKSLLLEFPNLFWWSRRIIFWFLTTLLTLLTFLFASLTVISDCDVLWDSIVDLELVLLQVLLNFVGGFKLELIFISLFESFSSFIIHFHDFHFRLRSSFYKWHPSFISIERICFI